MAAFTKYQSFSQAVGRKVHNLHTDSIKILLSNTAPDVAADTVKADAAEIGAGNGYTAGGTAIPGQSFTQTAGVALLDISGNVVFTASGGTIGPFRYAILYNDTAASDELIGYWDYGSSITLQDGENFTVDLDEVAGILTIT